MLDMSKKVANSRNSVPKVVPRFPPMYTISEDPLTHQQSVLNRFLTLTQALRSTTF